jgi:hypothetical protein
MSEQNTHPTPQGQPPVPPPPLPPVPVGQEAPANDSPPDARPETGPGSQSDWRLASIIGGVVLLLIAVVIVIGSFEKDGGGGSGKDVPDVELSIPARDTLIGSAGWLKQQGRDIDTTSWRYGTPACQVLSDYYGAYLTTDAARAADQTADDVQQHFMSDGPVGASLRSHVRVFRLEDNTLEITEAAMACSEYIATQH